MLPDGSQDSEQLLRDDKSPFYGRQRGGAIGIYPRFKSRRRDLNPQPPLYESGALPLSYFGEKSDCARTISV